MKITPLAEQRADERRRQLELLVRMIGLTVSLCGAMVLYERHVDRMRWHADVQLAMSRRDMFAAEMRQRQREWAKHGFSYFGRTIIGTGSLSMVEVIMSTSSLRGRR